MIHTVWWWRLYHGSSGRIYFDGFVVLLSVIAVALDLVAYVIGNEVPDGSFSFYVHANCGRGDR